MYKIKIFILIVFFLFFIAPAYAGLNHVGTLDSKKENFYYTGLDIYSWSMRKAKVYKEKFGMILKYNFKDKEEKVIYAGDCPLSSIKLSPDDNYIGGYCPKENLVVIFDMVRKNVVEIKGNVYEFAWHPDSKKIVYVTGEKSIRKGPYGMALKPDGIWIYDIVEEKKENLPVLGKHIRLSQKERNLTLWNGERWVKYDFDTGKVTETSMTLEDVDYSPDEQYYMDASSMDFKPPYWSPFRIYDAKSNTALPAEEVGFISERNPQIFIWGNAGKLFFGGMTSRMDVKEKLYIYDFAARKLIRQFDGEIAGHSDNLLWLVIYRNGKFYLESF